MTYDEYMFGLLLFTLAGFANLCIGESLVGVFFMLCQVAWCINYLTKPKG